MYLATARGVIDQSVILKEVYFHSLDETRLAVVITPTCDFEQQKCEYIQACALFDAWEIIEGLIRGSWAGLKLADAAGALRGPLSKGKQAELEEKLKRLIGQQFGRYHWLSPWPGTDTPAVADFQLVGSFGINELTNSQVVAELRSPFREQFAARYAAYMGRVGTDDPSDQQIKDWITQCIARLFAT